MLNLLKMLENTVKPGTVFPISFKKIILDPGIPWWKALGFKYFYGSLK